MHTNGYLNYLENEVLTADPIKLIQLLYRGALDATSDARRCLAVKDIRGRSRALTKATVILAELAQSLDYEKGGEVSRNLAGLYDYILRLLLQSNSEQSEAPLLEAERLLNTLADAWDQCAPPAAPKGDARYVRDPASEVVAGGLSSGY
jgi:flagellar protein FliS